MRSGHEDCVTFWRKVNVIDKMGVLLVRMGSLIDPHAQKRCISHMLCIPFDKSECMSDRQASYLMHQCHMWPHNIRECDIGV